VLGGPAADGGVETRRRHIVQVGHHPCLAAPELATHRHEGGQQPSPDAAALMGRCDADLVDPQLGRLVWMDVVDRGGKADDRPGVDRDGDVVSGVVEELGAETVIDRPVEHVRRDTFEHLGVPGPENLDVNRHGGPGSTYRAGVPLDVDLCGRTLLLAPPGADLELRRRAGAIDESHRLARPHGALENRLAVLPACGVRDHQRPPPRRGSVDTEKPGELEAGRRHQRGGVVEGPVGGRECQIPAPAVDGFQDI